jgi:hypothetical protein
MAVQRLFTCVAILTLFPLVATARFAERNVNMVSGTQWPGGDPFLRQQNEPSIAVSTRNPLHLLAGANDYRSVDIPFLAAVGLDGEERGDAWLGVFKSKDGGNTWSSTLLDGFPQQANSNSPLKGFQAAADPVVRAGNGGMFYFAGIVLNRGDNPLGGVFMARFIDNNNSEVSDPVAYLDTKLIDKGTPGQFIDKPWFAIAKQTNGGQCTISGQTFAAQNIYLAYSVLLGDSKNVHTKMMFTRSTDCGATWDRAIKLSESFHINQGATIATDLSGAVYVIWRRFQGNNDPHSIIMAKSTDQGRSFTKGMVVTNITPFEQGTTTTAVRTNAYPTAAVDDSGRLHVAWSQRDVNGDGRIVLITSTDGGTSWSAPRQVDNSPDRGHQFMPSMTFSAGKLTLAWYDQRLDHTIGTYQKTNPFTGFYEESRTAVGNLALGQPQVIFWNFLADTSPNSLKLVRRHTLDVHVAEADPAAPTLSFTSVRASRYKFGSAPSHTTIQDLQINPPNLPMFRQGTVPFLGDYIDIAAYATLPGSGVMLSTGSAVSSVPSRVRHLVWTDNRDVRPPLGNPPDWTKYTPVNSPALGGTSKFDPNQTPPPCDARFSSSRNQNIYTTRVTDGLFTGSPGNAKPLGKIQRAFSVFVQNARNTTTAYRLSIAQQPPAPGSASFLQFSFLDHLDVTIPPHSTATRTVFVTGAAHTRVNVNVAEITAAGGAEVPGGLGADIVLNADPSNPDIGNPDIGNPDIGNAEVFNPDIGNPDIGNPDIGNPDIGNPDIGNPDIGNPDIGNPDIGNPDIGNPDIGNPDIGNPDIGNPDIGNAELANGAVTDTTWTADNQGNTTGGFTVKLLKNGNVPAGFRTQLILNKIYSTPVARNCNLGVEHHRQIVTNINNPTFATISDLTNAGLTDSSEKSATMWLAPGEKGRITFRVVDPNRFDNITFDAATSITPVVIAQSVNTLDADGENTTPSISLTIVTTSLPDGVVGKQYSTTLQAIGGVGARTWSATGLPAGLTLNGATGVISGTPQAAGTSSVVITVTDSAARPHTKARTLTLQVFDPLIITTNSLPDGTVGRAYNATVNTTGGVPPRAVTVAPPLGEFGLSLDRGTGVISGTPSVATTFNLTFTATDSASPVKNTAVKMLTLRIAPPLVINTLSIPNAIVNQPYSTTIQATGGQPPYFWSVKAPQELSINAQGVLSGTFNAPNGSFVTVTVLDSGSPQRRADQQYNFSAVVNGITGVTPAVAAAGFGQTVTLNVQGLTTLEGLTVDFSDGTFHTPGFLFAGVSSPQRIFARLPFVGDGRGTNRDLTPGPVTVFLMSGQMTLGTASLTLSPTPGTPVIQSVLGLSVSPSEANQFCGSLQSTTPVTTINPGQGIAVSAFGIDTTRARLRFEQAGRDAVFAGTQCAHGDASLGIAPAFTVPNGLVAGDVAISISTTVGESRSSESAVVHFTIVIPQAFTCTGEAFTIFNNWNEAAVENGGTPPSFTTDGLTLCLDHIADYHWNGGNGAPLGTIGLTKSDGTTLGPWQSVSGSRTDGRVNIDWIATPPAAGGPVILNGDYTVNDSDGATWAQNTLSGGFGFSQVWVKDATPGVWAQKATTPTSITGHAVGVVNSKLYSLGGQSAASFSAPTFAYNPATNMWTTKKTMTVPRKNLAAGTVNGLIYVVGGDNDLVHFGTNEAYDPATDSWTSKADMPTIRSGHGIGVVNGILYAVGGYNATALLAKVEAYDPATNTWSTKAPMPGPRRNLAVAVVGGTLYAIGGLNNIDGDIYLRTVEAYDPVTNTWTTKTSMPTARASLAVASVNGIIYAFGGSNPGALTTVEAYNPATNTWSTVTSMPNAKHSFGAAELGGVIYAVGGINGNSVIIDSVDGFTP